MRSNLWKCSSKNHRCNATTFNFRFAGLLFHSTTITTLMMMTLLLHYDYDYYDYYYDDHDHDDHDDHDHDDHDHDHDDHDDHDHDHDLLPAKLSSTAAGSRGALQRKPGTCHAVLYICTPQAGD